VASLPSHWLLGHQRAFYRAPISFTANAVARFRTNIRLNLQKRTYLIVGPRDVEQVLKRQPDHYQPAGIARIVPAFAAALAPRSLGTKRSDAGWHRSSAQKLSISGPR
jgi:hypothetical protein